MTAILDRSVFKEIVEMSTSSMRIDPDSSSNSLNSELNMVDFPAPALRPTIPVRPTMPTFFAAGISKVTSFKTRGRSCL
jgi:hypothetical protein